MGVVAYTASFPPSIQCVPPPLFPISLTRICLIIACTTRWSPSLGHSKFLLFLKPIPLSPLHRPCPLIPESCSSLLLTFCIFSSLPPNWLTVATANVLNRKSFYPLGCFGMQNKTADPTQDGSRGFLGFFSQKNSVVGGYRMSNVVVNHPRPKALGFFHHSPLPSLACWFLPSGLFLVPRWLYKYSHTLCKNRRKNVHNGYPFLKVKKSLPGASKQISPQSHWPKLWHMSMAKSGSGNGGELPRWAYIDQILLPGDRVGPSPYWKCSLLMYKKNWDSLGRRCGFSLGQPLGHSAVSLLLWKKSFNISLLSPGCHTFT